MWGSSPVPTAEKKKIPHEQEVSLAVLPQSTNFYTHTTETDVNVDVNAQDVTKLENVSIYLRRN